MRNHHTKSIIHHIYAYYSVQEITLLKFLPCLQRTRPDRQKLGIALTCIFTKWVNKHIVSFQIWFCVRATISSDLNPECAVRRQQCQTAELIPQVNAQLNWHRKWMLSWRKCYEKTMKLSSWVFFTSNVTTKTGSKPVGICIMQEFKSFHRSCIQELPTLKFSPGEETLQVYPKT